MKRTESPDDKPMPKGKMDWTNAPSSLKWGKEKAAFDKKQKAEAVKRLSDGLKKKTAPKKNTLPPTPTH